MVVIAVSTSYRFSTCVLPSSATLSLSILILHPFLIESVIFLLFLLVRHILDSALTSSACALCDPAPIVIDLESFLTRRLTGLLACLCTRVPELSLWVDCVYDVVWPLTEELDEEKVVD